MKSRRESVFGIILLLGVVVLYTWATWQFFTRLSPGGNDFLAHYAAWAGYLREGVNPYSDEAALHTQLLIYGRAALPGEDQNRMTYPFYSIGIYGPFALIEDYPLARALYMTISQIVLIGGIILCFRLLHWQSPTALVAFVLIWSLLYYHDARGILLGQFAIFAFGALATALLLLQRKHDALAGAIFVIATVKPPLVFLLAPFLLGWGVARRRWHFVGGFLATLTILVVGSFIVLPSWMSDWLSRVSQYMGYTANQSPVWTIALMGLPVTIIYVGGLVLLLLWSWWRAWRVDDGVEFFWTLGITLVISNLISPRTATTDYVLMLIPTLAVFAVLDRVPRWGRFALIALMAISLVGLWGLHLATVQGNWEQSVMYLPWPLALGVVWAAGRRWLIPETSFLLESEFPK